MLRTTMHGAVVELTLDRPPANALTTALFDALRTGLGDAQRAGARAIVLSGRPGMFSGGIDVPVLMSLSRTEMAEFWAAFFHCTRALVASPLPVVAAIGGHAPAGGAVLAIHCDHRIAAAGAFKIGFNEVAVGLPVPSTFVTVLQHVVGHARALQLAASAELIGMPEALRLGLVDELVEPDGHAARALACAQRLASLPPQALAATRAVARAGLLAALDTEGDIVRATEAWFSDETQAGLQALVARLSKK